MEKNNKMKVGIVIVSYNSATELGLCLKSAQAAVKHAGVGSEIVVVDNASKDRSCAVAEKAGIKVIANDSNLGFSMANNIGIRYLFEAKCTHILILNPDAMMQPASLSVLIDGFDPQNHIGATGPGMLDGKGKSATAGYYLKAPTWFSTLLFSTFLRPHFIKRPFFVKHFYEETGLDHDRVVEQIPGACLFTSKKVLDDIGLLDEDFAIWFEDVEWCYRARKNGYVMQYCHDALVQHEGGVSFAKWQNLDKAVTFYVSMKTFFRKHKPLSYPLFLLVVAGNSLALYLKNHDKSNLAFLKKFLKQRRGILPN